MGYPVFYVPAGDVLPIFFATFDGGTGASSAATGLAVTDIEIYKDGSVTQRSSDAGYTLLDTDGLDFDGLTGINGFSIDTGDNTDSGFYTVGAWFTVVVSSITVDGQTVSFIAAQFRLMPAEGVAGKPKVDTDTFGGSAGTFSSGRPEVNTTHAAGTAWGSGAITAASIASDAITAAKVAADVSTEIRDKIVERTTLRGTVSTSSTTTSITTSAMSPATSAADQVKGRIVIFDHDTTTAALRGQATDITASSASSTPTLTVTALTTAPASGDTFTIV